VLTHVITQGSRRNVKLTLDVRVVMNGQGVRKVVVTEKEPCQR
jgi:hypothetical protein